MAEVQANNVSTPATHAAVITPSDEDTILPTRGVYVGGTGHLEVTMAGDGGTVLFSAIPAGTILPIRVTQVLAANTTATLIVAMW